MGEHVESLAPGLLLRASLKALLFVTTLASRSAGRAHGRRAATRRHSGRRSPAGSGGSSPSARCPLRGPRQPVPGSRRSRPPGPGRRCRPRSCSLSRTATGPRGRSGLWHRLRQACNHAHSSGPSASGGWKRGSGIFGSYIHLCGVTDREYCGGESLGPPGVGVLAGRYHPGFPQYGQGLRTVRRHSTPPWAVISSRHCRQWPMYSLSSPGSSAASSRQSRQPDTRAGSSV